MKLALGHVRKPIRGLCKSLRRFSSHPSEKAVHSLRTRTRRIEALAAVLIPPGEKHARPLLKSIKPLRKAAGDVRDMDVLEAKVQLLLRQNPDPAFESLLEHLRTAREKSAQELADRFAPKAKKLHDQLDRFSKYTAQHLEKAQIDPRKAHELFDALCHWPRLNAGNLHEFRIRIKDLRYMMQLMENPNSAFIRALENARTRIGTWHDWEELHRIAAEILDAKRDRRALAAISEMEAQKFRSAMRAAQLLRTNYLSDRNGLQTPEP